MTRFLIFLLFFNLFYFQISAQIYLEGKIYVNNEPQSNVSVYLNNTTTGTITNKDGEFNLEVKNGVHQLIISHLGFKTIAHNVDTETYKKPLVFSLLEEDFPLDEVVVKGKRSNDDWEYHYSVFVREFIGTDELSKHCTIKNRDVLSFEFDAQNNVFTAKAIEPLLIENEALGYAISYDLQYFSLEKNISKYLGYSYFKELRGSKGKHKKWRKNRLKAYHGSQLHFYRSVVKHALQKEGFVINQFVRKKNKDRPSPERVIRAGKILSKSNVVFNLSGKMDRPENSIDSALIILEKAKLPKYIDYLSKDEIASSDIILDEGKQTYLLFNHNLRVTYLREKEENNYILRNPFSKPRKAVSQASNVIPLAKKIKVYPIGVLANPLDVLYEGYWSYTKFANSLPLDYRESNED
ncbi:carboxypeptidase-like regulatory domain-containing protein [Maribacter sp. 2307ULW6-5]|uniref:carboxypeptidase-like regulatory domain-containing protein n=1 Tax=Maribacter sp. 2307ULW6-5 TaxID=3386275 RepID=UPI0039BD89E1